MATAAVKGVSGEPPKGTTSVVFRVVRVAGRTVAVST